MRVLFCLLGQSVVYEESCELLEEMMGIEISAPQIQRVCTHYGNAEAAHRSVIQQRLKLSGQKWSVSGAQAIADLRCYKHSGAWSIIKKIIAAAA